MKNYRLSCFLNSLLIGIIVLFLSQITLHFASGSKMAKLFTSILFSLSFFGFAFLIQRKRNGKLMLKEREQKQANLLLKKLEVMPDNQLIALLLQIFEGASVDAKVNDNTILIEGAICFFDLSHKTSRSFLQNAIKRANGKNVILFCNRLDDEAEDLLNDFKNSFAVVDGNSLYILIKKYCTLPSNIELDLKTKGFFASLRALLIKNFTKKRAVTFTLIGIALCFLSKLTFFPRYYLLCALFSLLIALTCLIFGKEEQKGAKNILPLEFIK